MMRPIQNPIQLVKGETKTISYQFSDTSMDITNYTFKLAVKTRMQSQSYLIQPFDAVKDIANRKFSFTFTAAMTSEAIEGVFEVTMLDSSPTPLRTVLTKPGGVAFEVVENIVD